VHKRKPRQTHTQAHPRTHTSLPLAHVHAHTLAHAHAHDPPGRMLPAARPRLLPLWSAFAAAWRAACTRWRCSSMCTADTSSCSRQAGCGCLIGFKSQCVWDCQMHGFIGCPFANEGREGKQACGTGLRAGRKACARQKQCACTGALACACPLCPHAMQLAACCATQPVLACHSTEHAGVSQD